MAQHDRQPAGSGGIELLIRVWLPVAVAGAFVIDAHANYASVLIDLWRPLLVATAASLLIQAAVILATRNGDSAPYLGLAITGALLGMWLLVLAMLAIVAAVRIRALRYPLGDGMVVRTGGLLYGGAIASVFMTVAVARAVVAFAPWQTITDANELDLPGSGGPDIFIVLLDGYPSVQTLRRASIDVGPFIDDLERDGFAVDVDARSNYTRTWLTLATLLHANYAVDIPAFEDPPRKAVEQYRLASRVISQAPFAEALRGRGYEITTATSAYTETALDSADHSYHVSAPSNFEHYLIRNTSVAGLITFVHASLWNELQRDGVAETLEVTREVAGMPNRGPVFMLSHVLAPHPPFAATRTGAVQVPQACYPARCSFFEHRRAELAMDRETYSRLLEDYVGWLNDEVRRTVAAIVRDRPNAVVILMSDHGLRHENEKTLERFSVFFAARTPGQDGAFQPMGHTANIARAISNAYFGSQLPMLPYQAWDSSPDLLDLRVVDYEPRP